jgi:phospholipid/cholesterol/gamma-HCH transport system substrate-binding protein
MAVKTLNNLRLGIFVLVGILILVVSLYTIGRNDSLFGQSFQLRARFSNINGLMVGNNVRYAGIQAGTVTRIELLNDSAIEVTMVVDKKINGFIKVGAWASIGSEGLMGNKVVNIAPGKAQAPAIARGALLNTKQAGDTDDMIATLSASNDNLLVISENLKDATIKLNNSGALWRTLNDTGLSRNIRQTLANVQGASVQIHEFSVIMNEVGKGIKQGKGVAGMLLQDQATAADVRNTASNLSKVTSEVGKLVSNTDSMVQQVRNSISDGQKSVAHTILYDTSASKSLSESLNNIQSGTKAFNENMEALKHNFLTKGYFKKQAKANSRKNKSTSKNLPQ